MVLSLGFSVSTPTMSTNRATILGHRLAAHALPQDGTTYPAVLYRHDGRQTSMLFEDLTTATTFKDLVDVVGPAKALASVGADQHPNRVSANPPPPTTAACKIEARASCN